MSAVPHRVSTASECLLLFSDMCDCTSFSTALERRICAAECCASTALPRVLASGWSSSNSGMRDDQRRRSRPQPPERLAQSSSSAAFTR